MLKYPMEGQSGLVTLYDIRPGKAGVYSFKYLICLHHRCKKRSRKKLKNVKKRKNVTK